MSRPTSPIDLLFKLGDKATKGDPQRQADFTYYLLWILFLAFFGMFGANLYRLIFFPFNADYIIFGVIGFAITALQYFNLKQMYEMRKLRKNPVPEAPLESLDEMLKGFRSKSKEVNKNVRKKKENS